MKLTLNNESKRSLEKRFGMSILDIAKMDVNDLDRMIERKIKRKLTYRARLKNFIGRGNVYLFLERLWAIEDVDKKLSKI